MNAERPVFERIIKKIVLTATVGLTLFQIGCRGTEPARAQAPTPSQGVATEVIPSTFTPEPTTTPKPPSFTVPNCLAPWIQTIGGDVHSNVSIDMGGN